MTSPFKAPAARLGIRGAAFLGPFDGNTFRITWNSYANLPTYGATNVMRVSQGIPMSDLVDVAIPANAQAAAEALLGLKVSRSVVCGVRIRQIEREDAELAIEFLRDWGFTARIVENTPQGEGPMAPLKRAA